MTRFAQAAQQGSMLAFLIGSMLAMGLGCSLRALLDPLRDFRRVLTILALNFVLAPALARLIAWIFPIDRGHAAGLLLLGGAAGAPFLPKLLETSRGDSALGTAVLVLLTFGTIVFLPVALPRMTPGLAATPWAIARPLLLLIVTPLLAGMLLRGIAPLVAARAVPVFAGIGNAGLLLFSALLVILNIRVLIGVIGSGAIAAATLYFASLFVLSWLLVGFDPKARGPFALATAARNFGAAFVPATGVGVDSRVTTMVLVSVIVCLVICFVAARWVRRRTPAASPRKTPKNPMT